MQGLDLVAALQRREWAALRVLAAAVSYRELATRGRSAAAWMAAADELARATDGFITAMQEAAPCPT